MLIKVSQIIMENRLKCEANKILGKLNAELMNLQADKCRNVGVALEMLVWSPTVTLMCTEISFQNIYIQEIKYKAVERIRLT
jgi:hypothetical protein